MTNIDPQTIVFVSLSFLSLIIYWVQGNKGMRDYLALLVCGTIIQTFWNYSDVWAIYVPIIQLRLIATIMGLISRKFRHNRELIHSLKIAFVATGIRLILGMPNMVDVMNIYLASQVFILVLTYIYFFYSDPAFQLIEYSLKVREFEIFLFPYKIKKVRRLKMNDSILIALGLYSIEYIFIYSFLPKSSIREYWFMHQIFSILFIFTILSIGVSYWLKREQMVWKNA